MRIDVFIGNDAIVSTETSESNLPIIENISYSKCEELLRSPFGTMCKRHGKNCKMYLCSYCKQKPTWEELQEAILSLYREARGIK